jgi:hypothetical protein
VTILNSRSVSSRETWVRNGIKKNCKAHILSSAGRQQENLGGPFNSALSEGQQLYSRI